MTTQTQTTAVIAALSTAASVIAAVAPAAPAVISLIQLAITLINENRDPTPEEWNQAIGALADAHAKAQAALLALTPAIQTVNAPTPAGA